MTKKQRYFSVLISFAIIFCIGCLYKILNEKTTIDGVPYYAIQSAYIQKFNQAYETLDRLEEYILENKIDQIHKHFKDENNGLYYYVSKNDTVIFWSKNFLISQNNSTIRYLEETYREMSNAYVVNLGRKLGDYNINGYILIKSKYNIDNINLFNVESRGVSIPNHVSVLPPDPENKYTIYSEIGVPLFSLESNNKTKKSIRFDYIMFLFLWLAFLFFIISYWIYDYGFGKQYLSVKYFILITIIYWILIYFGDNLAHYFLWDNIRLFSSIYYGSNLFKSLGQLIIITVFSACIVIVYLRKIRPIQLRHSDNEINKKYTFIYILIVQCISLAYCFFVIYITHDLIYNSALSISFTNPRLITPFSIISLIILLLWLLIMVLIKNGITEVFYSYFNIRILLVADILLAIIALLIAYICFDVTIIHLVCFIFTIIILIDLRYIVPKFRSSFLYTILILFVSLFMLAWYIIKESNINKTKQFEFIALKVAMGERIGYDKLTEENLGVVENQIKMDSTLREYIIYSKNVDKNYVSDYLKDNYFGNIWQLYELNIDILPYDQIKKKYMREKWDFIEFSGLTTPHFYKKRSPGSCSYKGIYKDANQNGDTIALYINLMRRQDSKYMEHPETGLISYSKNPWHRVSSALYYDNQLILSNGKFPYSKRFNFYKTWPNRFYQEYFDGHKHYTLMMDPHRRVIISEEAHPTWRLYIIFMTYMFCIFVAIAFLINLWINGDLFKNYYMKGSIFNKLKNFFILFLFVCIFVIMCISVHQLIQNKYEEKKADIMSSVNFVKSTIEKEIHNCNTNDYKDTYRRVMDELYEKYDLPIHLYDKSGGQILSTYPYLRINRITSRLINPDYFFRGNYETVILTEKIGNLEHLCGYATLYDKDNNNIGYICIPYYMSLSNLHEEIYRYILLFLNIYLAIIMLSIILFYIFTRNISGPVNEIRTKLDNLELGGKNEHINYPENRNDEIGALIKQYNNLIDDLDEKVNELAENERDNLWREIAKQIAHEIKNPLTPMKLAIQQMRRLKNTDRFDNYFDTATEMLMGQIDSLTNIASDFSSFARMAPTKLVPVNIIDRLISVLHLHMNNAEGIILEYDSTILHAMIMGDSEQLIQIFNNIIKNGMQAIPSDKEGNIKVKVEADIEYITITITDNGNGIPDSIKENIFKPNFTTKSSGNGIGLALVKTYVNAMGGEINFESQENIGTTFTLIFPLIKI